MKLKIFLWSLGVTLIFVASDLLFHGYEGLPTLIGTFIVGFVVMLLMFTAIAKRQQNNKS